MKVCEERDKKKRGGGGGASAVQGWDSSSEGAAVVDLTSSAANDQMYKLQKGPGDRDIRVSSRLRGIYIAYYYTTKLIIINKNLLIITNKRECMQHVFSGKD